MPQAKNDMHLHFQPTCSEDAPKVDMLTFDLNGCSVFLADKLSTTRERGVVATEELNNRIGGQGAK